VSGEREDIRRKMERFQGRLRREGMSPEKAREKARETALYLDRRRTAKESNNG
jgi:hypothetical protein